MHLHRFNLTVHLLDLHHAVSYTVFDDKRRLHIILAREHLFSLVSAQLVLKLRLCRGLEAVEKDGLNAVN